MKTSREQFEEWVKTTDSDMERYKTGIHKGDFKNPVMRKMWLAWQASRQCIEVEPPELLTTPVKQFEFERDCQWKEAISKAGIKVKGA